MLLRSQSPLDGIHPFTPPQQNNTTATRTSPGMSCRKRDGAALMQRQTKEPTALEMAVKRHREQKEEEEEAPAEALALLILVKSHFNTLVWAQLCNPQGVALFSFVRLPPRLPRLFAGTPVYDMSLTHAERLCAVGCGFKGKLVRLVAMGVGRHYEPQRNWGACHKMMQSTVRRVASKRMAAVRDEAAKEAEELCASGQCAAALVPLHRAIEFGDLSSRALKAWLHIEGREGVAENQYTAFALAEEGARFGCHHGKGVLAYCLGNCPGCALSAYPDPYVVDEARALKLARESAAAGSRYRCCHHCQGVLAYRLGNCPGCALSAYPDPYVVDEARALKLARESAAAGSRYGQHTLGTLLEDASNYAQALLQYRLAADQGLDDAQCQLGRMYEYGRGVALDHVEALRLYHLAAAQGLPQALIYIAGCHQPNQILPRHLSRSR